MAERRSTIPLLKLWVISVDMQVVEFLSQSGTFPGSVRGDSVFIPYPLSADWAILRGRGEEE